MLTRWHILLGAIFTGIIWYFSPNISTLFLLLVFLPSFLMNLDHYLASVFKSKNLSPFYSYSYHLEIRKKEKEIEKNTKKKGDFHLFHTIEFHALIGLLSLVWIGFFYIFLGMILHSFIDLFYLLQNDKFYKREFFLFRWIKDRLVI